MTAIVLASVSVVIFEFLFLSLPIPGTAIFLSTRGRKWEKTNGVQSSTLLQWFRVAAISSVSMTMLIVVLAICVAQTLFQENLAPSFAYATPLGRSA